MTIDEVLEYVREEYAIEEDYPFRESSHSVLRVKKSGKWFCLLTEVPGSFIGLPDNSKREIINLKNNPFEILSLLDLPFIYPAWHMNKKHWLTVDLSCVSDPEIVYSLLSESYQIVSGKKHI